MMMELFTHIHLHLAVELAEYVITRPGKDYRAFVIQGRIVLKVCPPGSDLPKIEEQF